jgi:predicted alpha/beta-fold hydrolase
LINAKDDMFLSKECYPTEVANKSENFYLEIPNYGGHVGFMNSFKPTENRWLEKRAIRFFKENTEIEIL